jgi:hypothetical protein
MKAYGIAKVAGDRWAGGIPPEMYASHQIKFEQINDMQTKTGQTFRNKTDLYIAFLHLANSRKVRLLDEPQSLAELYTLRTMRPEPQQGSCIAT